MDTAFNQPFEAYFVINPDTSARKVMIEPWFDRDTDAISEDRSVSIEENDELDLYFNSSDPNARLYLDALECCPMTSRILADDDGLIYCTPSEEFIKIYRSSLGYDALRVDTLQIVVVCRSLSYIAFLKVIPKQLSIPEWTIMRDDLEHEIRGLAQDVVRRSIGAGDKKQGALPPDDLYSFLVINKNAGAIMGALLDIKDRPKYKLQKSYEEVDESKNRQIDTETVKCYLRKGSSRNKLVVPRRDVVYDIQENRLLKKIVKNYDEKLSRFIEIIIATLDYRKQRLSKVNGYNLYEEKYIAGLEDYLETAKKLKKITNIIKSAEWFQQVKEPEDAFIPHSFAVDARYGILYRLYAEMNKHDFLIQIDPQYSYSWKKSSVLYEMWCYVRVCRFFLEKYTPTESTLDSIFTKGYIFPFLESGTKMILEAPEAFIEIVYDISLPRKAKHVQLYNNPFYVTGTHFRPDICINLYSKLSGWYIGSFVIECKYRKLTSFWEGTTWSSREQIIAYHNDSKSRLLFGGILDSLTSTRPVLQVFVFTPDIFENREYPDNKISLVTFRPTRDEEFIKGVFDQLHRAIDERIEKADKFYNRLHSDKRMQND